MAKTSYLNEDNVFQAYIDAKRYMQSYIDPVDEQERIARNQPHPGIDKSYPKVTDGTTSSIIQKTPRRIIQQLPTGRVKSDTNDWLSVVASFIYTNRIIPNANEQYALLQKCWLMVARAMAHGVAHSSAPFVNRGDYFGTDLKVHYIKNVKLESGKLSDSEANCDFLEGWFQPNDIDAIIAQEKELAKSAKERGEKYESTWDMEALEEVKTLISQMADDEVSKSIKTKHQNDTTRSGVKLVTALQRGVGAIQYTIHPSSEKIVRRKENKDPRGEPNLQSLYFETDGLSPLGRGIVEQVGSLQNLMDSEMQMYQYNRALMLNPPVIKRGNFLKSQVKFAPNVIIDVGSDKEANVTPMTIDTTAIQSFPQNYGLMKSQLLNLTASPDTSISAEVGNPGFSKTPAGVNAQQANVSVDDNYIRKQFETWYERWSETAINLYFAERTGVEELQLDEETALKLRKLEQEGKLEPGFVSEDNKIVIDYDTATEALKFEVDASTSNMKNDAQQLEALDGLLARLEKSPILAQTIPQEKILGAWNAIVASSGVENPEDLSIDIEQFKQEQEQKAQMEAQQQQQMLEASQQMPGQDVQPQQPQILPPSNEMPPEMPGEVIQDGGPEMQQEGMEQQPTQDDLAFIQALQDMDFSDEQIQLALGLDQEGRSNEEIIMALERMNG